MEKEIGQNNINITTPDIQTTPEGVSRLTPQNTQTSEDPKRKPLLIIVLTVLVVVLLGISGFFIYRNYQLKQKPSQKQSRITPPPIISTEPTPIEQIPTTSVNNINNSMVIFEKNGEIFLLKGLGSQPIGIAKGNTPVLSPDRSKIAYVKMDVDKNIYVYDIVSTKTETIQTTDEWRLRGVEWSLSNKYLITDSGTDVVGAGGVYEYPGGKKIASFRNYGKTEWVNNNEFVFEEPQEVSPLRPYGGGQGSGLAKMKLPTGEKQVLTQATSLEDFSLLKVEKGVVYFSKRAVKNSDDWSDPEKPETTYWQINSDGTGKKTISKPETLREKVVNYLPAEFSGYRIFSGPIVHPNFSNWVIFDINKEGSVYNDPICIMDISNPQNTFKQIATGSYPSW